MCINCWSHLASLENLNFSCLAVCLHSLLSSLASRACNWPCDQSIVSHHVPYPSLLRIAFVDSTSQYIARSLALHYFLRIRRTALMAHGTRRLHSSLAVLSIFPSQLSRTFGCFGTCFLPGSALGSGNAGFLLSPHGLSRPLSAVAGISLTCRSLYASSHNHVVFRSPFIMRIARHFSLLFSHFVLPRKLDAFSALL